MTEMPITQLMERVNTEMNDNPALEQKSDDYSDYGEGPDASDLRDSKDESSDYETEERQQAMDDAYTRMGSQQKHAEEIREIVGE